MMGWAAREGGGLLDKEGAMVMCNLNLRHCVYL